MKQLLAIGFQLSGPPHLWRQTAVDFVFWFALIFRNLSLGRKALTHV
jgi:hypothetical protein